MIKPGDTLLTARTILSWRSRLQVKMKNVANHYLYEKISSKYLDGSSNKFRTSPLDGSNEYQLWKLDEDGRLVNKASGKYFNYGEMVEVDYHIIYSKHINICISK